LSTLAVIVAVVLVVPLLALLVAAARKATRPQARHLGSDSWGPGRL